MITQAPTGKQATTQQCNQSSASKTVQAVQCKQDSASTVQAAYGGITSSIQSATMNLYSVAVGRQIGIFEVWKKTQASIQLYPGARFRKFAGLQAATEYLNRHGIPNDQIRVYTDDDDLPLRDYADVTPQEVEYERETLFDMRWGLFAEITEQGLEIYNESLGGGRKGFILKRRNTWQKLKELLPEAQEALDKVNNDDPTVTLFKQVGKGSFHVSVDSPYRVINIRRWFKKDDEWRPSRDGLGLRAWEVKHLMNISHLIERSWNGQ